jgi:hypothetical protein
MKLCHGTKLTERKSNKDGLRLFTCSCGNKFSWTATAGYFQQGRPRVADPKVIVKSKRVTAQESRDMEKGIATLEVVYYG